jgi:hypothetical protein
MDLLPIKLSTDDISYISQTIPSFETVLTDWSEVKDQNSIIKVNHFLALLSTHLKESKEIDLAYLESTEAKEIFQRLIQMSVTENNVEKIELINLFQFRFFDKKFSADNNKLEMLQILENIKDMEVDILHDTAEWLVLAYGREIVKNSTDHVSGTNENPYHGNIMESIIAMFSRSTLENIVPHVNALIQLGLFAPANHGQLINHLGQSGRGFKPTKLGIQFLNYLGVQLENFTEKAELKRK